MLVLPALGLALFSPSVRAHFCTLRADYAGAAQIYEKLLARNPKRVNLYPKLANLYLILGRMDERALKIFKTILQLNLATPNLEQINTIVAQHFLTEGRTDSDAIQVLEDALKAEQGKKKP
jgi:tetratricopeptide (TPR) repeat protein